jgi:two-component system sensor histidine kinase HydH
MGAPSSFGFEQIRTDAVRRMFARTPRLAILIFEPTFAGLCLYTAFTAVAPWRFGVALGLLAGIVAVNLLPTRRVLEHSLRWLLGIGLVAISGGVESPFMPFLLLSVLFQTATLGGRAGCVQGGLSIVALWGMALVQAHDATCVRAAAMTLLLVGAVLVGSWIRDISEHMLRSSLEARDELVGAYGERIRDLSTLQGELANALKNPLSSIKGLAGLMALEPARVPERLNVMRREICRMQTIVDEYLSFARPLTPLEPAPLRTSSLITAVAKLHEGLASDKQVTLDVTNAACVEMFGDPRKLKQILVSLMVNAIEASEEGGVVELTSRREGDRVILGVLDRGPGICADLLARATEPGVTTKENGTGLGLTIVRALAEQHGGGLRLQNREGGGLAAEVELPLRCSLDACARPLA